MKMIAAWMSACLAAAAAVAAQSEAGTNRSARVAALPLVEVRATAASSPATAGRMAVLLSGDGGWASLDRSIAANFASRGIPVIGINSLRYFWNGRTPEEAASDVAAIIEEYAEKWRMSKVDLAGFSFGADALPFIANRLPAVTTARLATLTLIEPSESATFKIHVLDWLPGAATAGLPLAPEVGRLKPAPLCLYGDNEPVPCRLPDIVVERIGTDHHLGGDGKSIVDRILR